MSFTDPFSFSEAASDPDIAAGDAEAGVGALTGFPAPPKPPVSTPPVHFVGYNQDTNEVFVNGSLFALDDAKRALESENELGKPIQQIPPGFRPVAPDEYKAYLDGIENPSTFTLAKKNFGIGVDNLQLLAGYGLQFLGAEETGAAISKQQLKDLAKNEPYQRVFTDVESTSGMIDWFVANAAQQGPMLIESALAAIIGAGFGAVVGGGANPFTAVAGGLAGLGGKAALKQAIMTAAKKRAGGEALDAVETKLLREAAAGGAAAITTAANSYGIGIADITGEQIEGGTRDRGTASLLAIPYALFDLAPEAAALGFLAKSVKPITKGGRLKKGAQRAGRVARASAVGAVAEGGTEALQEALLITQNPEIDFDSREAALRLINSFAAGAGVGGTLAAGGQALRRTARPPPINIDDEGADLLQLTDQRPPSGPLQLGGPGPIDLLGGPGSVALLEGPPLQLPLPPQTPYLDPRAVRREPPVFQPPTLVPEAAPEPGPQLSNEPSLEEQAIINVTGLRQAYSGLTDQDKAAAVQEARRLAQTQEGGSTIAPAPPVNPAFGNALAEAQTRSLAESAVALRAAQEAEAADIQERAREQARADAIQEEQFRQAEENLATQPEPVGTQPDIGILQQGVEEGQQPNFVPPGTPDSPIAIAVPIGDTVGYLNFTVREALADAKERVQALLDLRACLRA